MRAPWRGHSRSLRFTHSFQQSRAGRSKMNASSFGGKFAQRFALRRTLLATIAAVIALAAGCAQYRPAPISASVQAEALQDRTLDDSGLQTFIAASLGPENATNNTSWDLAK